MSDSTSLLDILSASQAQKEVAANNLFNASSPAALFGRRGPSTAALTWGYYGGRMIVGGVATAIPNGTVALAANATNYFEVNTAGAPSVNSVGFTTGRTPLYSIVTGASGVVSYQDFRSFLYQASFQPYDLSAMYPGAPPASALMLRIPLARAVLFPAGLAGSRGTATLTATATTAFDIQLNGASVATMTFAAGTSTATFTAASTISAEAGDVLSVVAPATPDATLADVGFVLSGTR